MNAVADTNVVAYFLLGTESFANEARRFWTVVNEAWAPAHWEAELANVVWMAVRNGVLSRAEGHHKLDLASRLGVRAAPVRPLWQPALARALDSGVAVYDSLFIETAVQRDLKLATFDRQLLTKFPGVAVRPSVLTTR